MKKSSNKIFEKGEGVLSKEDWEVIYNEVRNEILYDLLRKKFISKTLKDNYI